MDKEIKKVNINDKQDVKYCIPEWLREEQIRMSVAKYHNRVKPSKEIRKEPIALACYGPSLKDTWRDLKEFDYIISCSGSHGFLRKQGITPTWHVEVDPRAHKVQLIGNSIGEETEFLMASCCHPLVFEHLEKYHAKIVLWHTYSGENKDRVPLVFPRGEWVIMGGSNVGLRALTIARFLGFVNIHVFGMDGSFPADSKLKHADFHPNICANHILTEYEGKEYATTPAFLECAKQTFHEISTLPDINMVFHGTGLIQDMAKKKVIRKKGESKIAFCTVPTISAAYIDQNRQLHESNPLYGVSVLRHVETIKKIYKKIDAKSLLDFGCGKGLLALNLDFPIWEYDPAIPGKDSPPHPADLVVCVDVLEHVEPECIDAVLWDLARCTKKVGYFIINTMASRKTLPDGRNTHLIQEKKEWWNNKLSEYFTIADGGIFEKNSELYVVVSPKPDKKYKNEEYVIQTNEGKPWALPNALMV